MNKFIWDIKIALLLSPIVKSFNVIKERFSSKDGHLRIKCNLINNDILEFSIFAEMIDNIPSLENYSYHWQQNKGKLIRRWDNTPHNPELESLPHHVHVSEEANVESSDPKDIQKILTIIEQKIDHTKE